MIKHSVGYNYLQDCVLAKSANKSLKFMEIVAAFFLPSFFFGCWGYSLPWEEKHQHHISKTAETFTLFLNLYLKRRQLIPSLYSS